MSNDLSIAGLIANGTLSAEQAATLWAMVEEQHSFVVVAIPRLAGKSTTMNAILGLLSPAVPVHRLSGDEAEMAKLKEEAKGGYLVASEMAFRYWDQHAFQIQLARRIDAVPLTRDYIHRWEQAHMQPVAQAVASD